jgi:hypothetical protein
MKKLLFFLVLVSIVLSDDYIHLKFVESNGHVFENHAIKIEAEVRYAKNHCSYIERYVAFDSTTNDSGIVSFKNKTFPAPYTVLYKIILYEYQSKSFTIIFGKMTPEVLYIPHVCLQKHIKVQILKEKR